MSYNPIRYPKNSAQAREAIRRAEEKRQRKRSSMVEPSAHNGQVGGSTPSASTNE